MDQTIRNPLETVRDSPETLRDSRETIRYALETMRYPVEARPDDPPRRLSARGLLRGTSIGADGDAADQE
jgi:hypothetical protein